MDEQFKRKLSTVRVDWNKEKLWQELEPKLPVKKRRYHWVWFLFLLLGGFGTGIYFHINTNPIIGCLPLAGEHTNAVIALKTEAINSIIDTSTYIIKPEFLPRKSSERISGELRAEEAPDVQSKLSMDQSTSSGEVSQLNEENGLPGKAKMKINKTLPVAANPVDAIAAQANTDAPEQVKDVLSLTLAENSIALLPARQAAVWFADTRSGADTFPKPMLFADGSRHQYSGFFVDLAAGAGTLSRSVDFSITDEETLATLQSHKAAEKIMFSIGSDLGVGYQFKSGLFIKSGVQYRMIQEHLSWENTMYDDSSMVVNSERAFFQLTGGGDTLFYNGEVTARLIESRKVFHKNRTSFYSIPVEIGFDKQLGKAYLSGRGGVNVTLISTFKGRMINVDDQVVNNPEIGLQSSLGYYLAVGMGYHIKRNLSIFLNASFEQSPTFFINSAKQNYQSYNIRMGVKKYLRR